MSDTAAERRTADTLSRNFIDFPDMYIKYLSATSGIFGGIMRRTNEPY